MHVPDHATRRRSLRRVVAWCSPFVWLTGLAGINAGDVEFHPTIEAARTAGDPDRPILLTFTSASCGWCRKLATSTFADERVTALSDRVLWVKADIDEQPALAAKFRVRGVPHTFVIDRNDRVLAAQPGYLPAEAFVTFVTEGLANPRPIDQIPDELLAKLSKLAEGEDSRAVVAQAVEMLSKQDAPGREVLLQSLHEAGTAAYPGLVALLADERLAVRAAAGELLKADSRAALPFDPFGDPATRAAQVEAWQSWLDETAPQVDQVRRKSLP
jgi:thioredoxin 1